jgi:hypothetical protein
MESTLAIRFHRIASVAAGLVLLAALPGCGA